MKQIIRILLLVTLICTGFQTSVAEAQLPPPGAENMPSMLADISLTNTEVDTISPGLIEISFVLKNNFSTPEHDLRYGVELMMEGDITGAVFDRVVADEVFGLVPNQEVTKTLRYDLSVIAPGTYRAVVKLYNSGGMTLGAGVVSGIVVTTKDVVSIQPSSCKLVIAGDSNTYEINSGIDIDPSETAEVECIVKNHSNAPMVVLSHFNQFERTRFGDVVTMNYPASAEISLAANQTKEVSFPVHYPSEPQAYDYSISLYSAESKKLVSNSIDVHYVLRGASATIQKATLDKVRYSQGDTMVVSLLWSPAADGFLLGSRSGTSTDIGPVRIKVLAIGADGVPCFDSVIVPAEDHAMTIELVAKKSCQNPELTVEIINETGTALAAKQFKADADMLAASADIAQQDVVASTSAPVESPASATGHSVSYFLIVVVAIGALGLLVYLGRKMTLKDTVIKSILFMVLAVSGYNLPPVETAEAVLFASPCHWARDGRWFGGVASCYYFYVNANLDKTTYVTSENMVLTSSMWNNYCVNLDIIQNEYSYTITDAANNIVSSAMILDTNGENVHFHTRTTDITAPATPGAYNLNLNFKPTDGTGRSTTGTIGFTVECPVNTVWSGSSCVSSPTITLTSDKPSVDPNDPAILTWSVSNANSCTASGGAWTGLKNSSGGTETVYPAAQTTYKLSCIGDGGTSEQSVIIYSPSGSLDAGDCPAPIPPEGSSCQTTVSWQANNFISSASLLQGTTLRSSAPSSAGTPYTVSPDTRTFTLEDTGGRFSISDAAGVRCADDSVWVSRAGRCISEPRITINPNPDIIRSGETAEVEIEVDSAYNLECSVAGGIADTFSHPDRTSGPIETYSFTTRPLTAAQMVQVDCEIVLFPEVDGTSDARINVIPVVQEI